MVYLIHFDMALGNERHSAQHYIGYYRSLKRRLADHKNGTGARILEVCNERGITWQVARTWPDGTRALERQLKSQKNAKRFCPICRGEH